jgi:hypothetical protein
VPSIGRVSSAIERSVCYHEALFRISALIPAIVMLLSTYVTVVDHLYQHYVGRWPLSSVKLIYTTFRKLALLPTSGDYFSLYRQLFYFNMHISGRGWKFFSSPPRPERLWDRSGRGGYQGLFPWEYSGQGVKLTTRLHLLPRSKNEWSYISTSPLRLRDVVLS